MSGFTTDGLEISYQVIQILQDGEILLSENL